MATLDEQFSALRQRHQRLAQLFKALQVSGHMEAAGATFSTAERAWDEAQEIHRRRSDGSHP